MIENHMTRLYRCTRCQGKERGDIIEIVDRSTDAKFWQVLHPGLKWMTEYVKPASRIFKTGH